MGFMHRGECNRRSSEGQALVCSTFWVSGSVSWLLSGPGSILCQWPAKGIKPNPDRSGSYKLCSPRLGTPLCKAPTHRHSQSRSWRCHPVVTAHPRHGQGFPAPAQVLHPSRRAAHPPLLGTCRGHAAAPQGLKSACAPSEIFKSCQEEAKSINSSWSQEHLQRQSLN